jgi:hypothetical protein
VTTSLDVGRLAKAILRAADEDDRRRTDDMFEWFASADEMAEGIAREYGVAETLCDEPGCRRPVTRGWPSLAGYRQTCYEHREQ